MKMINILWVIVVGLLLTGCYGDEGNYDYRTMNGITVDFNQSFYSVPIETELEISPIFRFAMDSVEDHLAYEWSFLEKVISTDRNLKYVFDTLVSDVLYLKVTDRTSGVSYFGKTNLEITAEYGQNGWVILSEKEGKSSLSFVREYTDRDPISGVTAYTYEEFPDVWKKMNPDVELGKSPLRVVEHFCANQNALSALWVIQRDPEDCVDVSGQSFKKDIALKEAFYNQVFPGDFRPIEIMEMKNISLAVSQDGSIYTRKKTIPALFNSGFYLDIPMDYEGKKLNGKGLLNNRVKQMMFTVLYDYDQHRFLAISDYNMTEAGKVMPINVSENLYKTPGMARLDNTGDMEVLHIGAWYGNGSIEQGYQALMRSPENVYYLYRFTLSSFMLFGPMAVASSVEQQEEKGLENCIEDPSSCLFRTLYARNTPYFIIANGNRLTLFDWKSGVLQTDYYTFEANISAIDTESFGNECVGIGLANGSFCVIDFSRDAVNALKTRLIYKSENDFGNIVDVCYKKQRGADWTF